MERIGGETMALYADLRERLETFESMRGVASLPGEFTRKTVKGRVYHYFQAMLPGGRAQIYIGPDGEAARRLIDARRRGERGVSADAALFERLGAQLIAGGMTPVAPDMARIIHRLADSGVFHAGGVLVGSLAFQVLGGHMGVLWGGRARMTRDVDLAVPDAQTDAPAAIDALKTGFFPVPRLSHKEPSTSYAIRGRTLRVDLLTPLKGAGGAPVFIRRLNAAAQPLKYLDYLIEKPVTAVMVSGTPCLVRVPQPARFALHKLILSRERDASSVDKTLKDVTQAKALLDILRRDRPGDIPPARDAAFARGAGWKKTLSAAAREAGVAL